jgi:hypothetical protein
VAYKVKTMTDIETTAACLAKLSESLPRIAGLCGMPLPGQEYAADRERLLAEVRLVAQLTSTPRETIDAMLAAEAEAECGVPTNISNGALSRVRDTPARRAMTGDRRAVDTQALTEAMAKRAAAEFQKWLRDDPTALSQMLHAPILEALEGAFSMGMYKGMVIAGERLRPAPAEAPTETPKPKAKRGRNPKR